MDMPAPINKTIQAKTMAELLPCLGGILSNDSIQTLTAKKQQRPNAVLTRTSEKVARPLTIAEMKADILALKVQSPKRFLQSTTASSKKRAWNSSVKVDKTISHTANGQLKNNPVRKVLNFQPKPKPVPNQRFTMMTSETPKFPKPESKPKKALHLKAKDERISGVFNIPETPSLRRSTQIVKTKSRMTIIANKENISKLANSQKLALPKRLPPKRYIPSVPDTPCSNDSWKSNCDSSFLQKEKEINDEEIMNAANNKTDKNEPEATQTVSTPFKEYRNVQEYFNHSTCSTSPNAQDNTIMCFDKSPTCGNQREESVIVSLCELLSKATVTQNQPPSTKQDELLQLEEQTKKRITHIDNVMEVLKSMRESEIESLESVRKMIQDNMKNGDSDVGNKTLVSENNIEKEKTPSPKQKLVESRLVSVIKSSHKSPTYKIPKKSAPLRKKVFHKSMPSVAVGLQTPPKDKAMTMYLKMKEQMKFLNTPVSIKPKVVAPDTPSMTSQNLQMQLDKLFTES